MPTDKIIGFHPTPEAAQEAGGEGELLIALSRHQSQAGRLQGDTQYFVRASQLAAETQGRTTVYIYEVEITEKTLTTIRLWYNRKREAPYNFPDPQDGLFASGERNCALVWNQFGIPLPVRTGQIRALVEQMKADNYDIWSSSL